MHRARLIECHWIRWCVRERQATEMVCRQIKWKTETEREYLNNKKKNSIVRIVRIVECVALCTVPASVDLVFYVKIMNAHDLWVMCLVDVVWQNNSFRRFESQCCFIISFFLFFCPPHFGFIRMEYTWLGYTPPVRNLFVAFFFLLLICCCCCLLKKTHIDFLE